MTNVDEVEEEPCEYCGKPPHGPEEGHDYVAEAGDVDDATEAEFEEE